MKKIITVLALTALAGTLAFAKGNAERLTTYEGEALFVENADGSQGLALALQNGERIKLELSETDKAALQIQERQRLMIKGVFIGETEGVKNQNRLYVRAVTANGSTQTCTEPVQLTERDRLQLREYEAIQSKTRTQDRTGSENQTESGTQTGSREAQSSGSTAPKTGKSGS